MEITYTLKTNMDDVIIQSFEDGRLKKEWHLPVFDGEDSTSASFACVLFGMINDCKIVQRFPEIDILRFSD